MDTKTEPKPAPPDCRVCRRYSGWGRPCRTTMPCVRGDQFIPDQPIYLWKDKP